MKTQPAFLFGIVRFARVAAVFAVAAAACSDAASPVAPRSPAVPSFGATPYQHNAITYHDAFEIDFTEWGPQWIWCAADGAGEWVDMHGTIRVQGQNVIDASANGVWHGESIFSGQNSWGVGRTTGTVYRAPLVNQASGTVKVDGSYSSSSIIRLRYVGTGRDGTENSFFLDALYHYTVNANLEPVVTIEKYEFTCPGSTPDPVF